MPSSPLAEQPFTFAERKDGTVAVSYEGRLVTTVAGKAAKQLVAKLAAATPEAAQLALAKITGNFKRGNERNAATHQRNR